MSEPSDSLREQFGDIDVAASSYRTAAYSPQFTLLFLELGPPDFAQALVEREIKPTLICSQ